MSSLFSITLDIDEQYLPMINDIIRIFTIQVVAQVFFGLVRKESAFSFVSEIFIQTLVFLLMGVLVYWLLIYKIIRIKARAT